MEWLDWFGKWFDMIWEWFDLIGLGLLIWKMIRFDLENDLIYDLEINDWDDLGWFDKENEFGKYFFDLIWIIWWFYDCGFDWFIIND